MVLAVLYIWNASPICLGSQTCLTKTIVSQLSHRRSSRVQILEAESFRLSLPGNRRPRRNWFTWRSLVKLNRDKVAGNNRAERGHGCSGCGVKQQRKDGLQELETLQQPLREGDSSAQWLENNRQTEMYWEPILHLVS